MDCVNWEKCKIRIEVPKKEHLDGHEIRHIPIFPEIRPYLEWAFHNVPDGTVEVIPKKLHNEGVLYAALRRSLRRLGINPWPKLLVNCRASLETELSRTKPNHKVLAYLGHSREVAEDHYLMTTDDDFLEDSKEPAQKAVQNRCNQ